MHGYIPFDPGILKSLAPYKEIHTFGVICQIRTLAGEAFRVQTNTLPMNHHISTEYFLSCILKTITIWPPLGFAPWSLHTVGLRSIAWAIQVFANFTSFFMSRLAPAWQRISTIRGNPCHTAIWRPDSWCWTMHWEQYYNILKII